MPTMDGRWPQYVIVYGTSDRGQGTAYDTAYTDKQITQGVARCSSHIGHHNVRSRLARDHALNKP